MLPELRKTVLKANLALRDFGLVIHTWGNVSEITDDRKYVAIKPSGVPYKGMKADDITIVELATGKVVYGKLRPSSDTPTHLEIYRRFPEIKGVAHTHSPHAVGWAQARKAIPCYGTTHADYFYKDIPCTPPLTAKQMENYEHETAVAIAKAFKEAKVSPAECPGVLVGNHGPFIFSTKGAADVAEMALTLETVALMASVTVTVGPKAPRADKWLVKKHYDRKHGPKAYYGQKKTGK